MDITERNKIFGKRAMEAATILCGSGQCIACYECGHCNHSNVTGLPPVGEQTVCPLSKYEVVPDTRSFAEKLKAGDNDSLDINGLFSICACCSHCDDVKVDGNEYTLDRSEGSYYAYCMDCPVAMAWDNLQEGMAEA